MFDKKDSTIKPSHQEPQYNLSTPSSSRNSAEKTVFIGQSIFIKGELTGNEDLTIEGKVEGNIALKDHSLTIGINGKIEAELFAKNITIMGEVHGNIYAQDKVEIAKSGKLRGNIVAPRLFIEDGARFKGSVEMDSDKKVSPPMTKGKNGEGKAPNGTLSVAGEKVGAR